MAASPEADEAIPEAVGNELVDSILKWKDGHSSLGIWVVPKPASLAILRMLANLFEMGSGVPFKMSESSGVCLENVIFVVVLRS